MLELSVMLVMALLAIGMIIGLIWLVFGNSADAEKYRALAQALTDEIQADHPGAKVVRPTGGLADLIVDFEKNCLLVLVRPKLSEAHCSALEANYKRYGFSDISEVCIDIDGVTLNRTNRGSQLMGAAIGAAALGGVGAVIGGLSGSSSTQERIRSATLIIKVDDRDNPIHRIEFFRALDQKKGDRKDSFLARPALQFLEEAEAHVSNAMRQHARSQVLGPQADAVTPQKNSIADALRVLVFHA